MDGTKVTAPAELYACLHAREFPLQFLLRLRPELRPKSVAVLEGDPPFEQVCSINSKARRSGLVRNMTRVEIDLFPETVLLRRSPAEEAMTKAALLECAHRFSPRVEEESSGTCFTVVIDITGTEKLFGSPQKLGEKLRKLAATLRIQASVVVSRNFHTALCLARGMDSSAEVQVVEPSTERAALASMPLSTLDIAAEHAETFSSWGIPTLGALAALPEKELITRFGQEGKRLCQLARGELPHHFRPIEPVFALEERMELDSPVEIFQSLLFALARMLDALIERAQSNLLALSSVDLELALERGAVHNCKVRPAVPSNERQLWLKLLDLELQAHPPNAPVLGLWLRAQPGSTSKVQLGLFCPQVPEPMRLDVTLARIRAIVGEDCVGRAVLKDTHRPDAFRIEPFVIPSSVTASAGGSEVHSGEPRMALRQLRPPEEIRVMLRNERPETFVFREKRYAVERVYGPWPARGDWWNPGLWSIEQWDLVARAQDESLLCCCLTHDVGNSCWRMEAFYD